MPVARFLNELTMVSGEFSTVNSRRPCGGSVPYMNDSGRAIHIMNLLADHSPSGIHHQSLSRKPSSVSSNARAKWVFVAREQILLAHMKATRGFAATLVKPVPPPCECQTVPMITQCYFAARKRSSRSENRLLHTAQMLPNPSFWRSMHLDKVFPVRYKHGYMSFARRDSSRRQARNLMPANRLKCHHPGSPSQCLATARSLCFS
jgi:hypothetical protein